MPYFDWGPGQDQPPLQGAVLTLPLCPKGREEGVFVGREISLFKWKMSSSGFHCCSGQWNFPSCECAIVWFCLWLSTSITLITLFSPARASVTMLWTCTRHRGEEPVVQPASQVTWIAGYAWKTMWTDSIPQNLMYPLVIWFADSLWEHCGCTQQMLPASLISV